MKEHKLFCTALLLFFLQFSTVFPQVKIEKYIEEGISNNIVLKQKQIALDKALYALKTATSFFFPSITLEGNYTSGEGGRNISFPVGDILNPVYQTLNQLTQSSRFPQLENVQIDFFPFHYYDVKLRTSMPLINTDLIFNRNIQSSQVQLQEYELDVYKRELVKEIKTAYYNYFSALSAEKIYGEALRVAEEGKKVNESLYKHGQGLPVYILRSESEIEQIRSQITEADNNTQKSKRYFNFLLNRDLDASIDTSFNISLKISEVDSIINAETDLSRREELKMLETGVSINETVLSMKKLFWVPKVSAFVDLGAQDQIWNYNSDSRYYLFGFQLSVPVFEAFRNHYSISSAELELEHSRLNSELVEDRIKLSQSISRTDLIAAKQNYNTALKNLETARSYERLISNGYKVGVNTFIETIDARTQLTKASLLVNISSNKVLAALANFERETASKINY